MFPAQANGLGFNPILQDPALAIHPPLLYIGYVGFSAAFSMGVATLSLNNNQLRKLIRSGDYIGQTATFTYFERTRANSYRHPHFKCLRNYE